MIDLDRASLDRVLPAPAGSPDWGDVLDRSREHERRRLITLAVVAVIAIVATASAFAVRAVLLDHGATALPPKTATPSSPESGELVVRYDGRPELSGFPTRFVPVNQVWVYADGRVLTRREGGPSGVYALGIGRVRTGFLERRLTPEGVELMQSQVISTGLFDLDRKFAGFHHLSWGSIEVRNGDRLVSVVWGLRATEATNEQAEALSRLTERLSKPAAWLPASAWEDREVRAYVPSRYAICFWEWEPPLYAARSLEPARVAGVLPATARALLLGKDATYKPFGSSGQSVVCSEVRTEEARMLGQIFTRAGFEPDPVPPGSPRDTYVNWRFRAHDPNNTVISFDPILPHGRWEDMGG